MNNISNYLCIGCPLGCRLEVESVLEAGKARIIEVRGHSCRRGRVFAEQEHTDPRRMVTTTVAVQGSTMVRLPVRTQAPVPKAEAPAICRRLRNLQVSAPVRAGDIIAPAVSSDGISVIAARDIDIGG